MIKILSIASIVYLLACLQAIATELSHVIGNFEWIVCIDGGGSKTRVSLVATQQNKREPINYNNDRFEDIIVLGPCNSLDAHGARVWVNAILGLKFWDYRQARLVTIAELSPRLDIIAGLAGAGSEQKRNEWQDLFESQGLMPQHLYIRSDVELALELVDEVGIVLIAGTGSICLGKQGAARFRAGGLGWFLGDEGGGFHIAKSAIAAVFAEEVGAGPATTLSPCVYNYLERTWAERSLRAFLKRVSGAAVSPKQIAAFAPEVFLVAHSGDSVAKNIIHAAAEALGCLVAQVLEEMQQSEVPIYLVGGVLNAPGFLEQVQSAQSLAASTARWSPVWHSETLLTHSAEALVFKYQQPRISCSFQGCLDDECARDRGI